MSTTVLTDTDDLQVDSDFGADGGGLIQVNRGTVNIEGGQIDYRSFQIFDAQDAAVCEVYYVVSRQVQGITCNFIFATKKMYHMFIMIFFREQLSNTIMCDE